MRRILCLISISTALSAALAWAGPLEGAMAKLVSDPGRDACESQYSELQLEVARELDRREAELKAVPPQLSQAPTITVGGLTFLENTIPAVRKGWTTYVNSWAEARDYYSKIKGSGTDARWAALNVFVRGLLSDDQMRVQNQLDFSLSREDEPFLASIDAAIEACLLHDPDCETPAFKPDDLAFIRSKKALNAAWARAADSASGLAKRELWVDLWAAVRVDAARFHVTPNAAVKRVSESRLSVALDGSAFGEEDRKKLAGYFESAWASPSLSVQVTWVSAGSDPAAYQVIPETEAGGRQYVTRIPPRMHLFSFSGTRDLAHEFGHVLGFGDHYYSVWDPRPCGYVVEYSQLDLMSSETGDATPEEWRDLDQAYPWRSR